MKRKRVYETLENKELYFVQGDFLYV